MKYLLATVCLVSAGALAQTQLGAQQAPVPVPAFHDKAPAKGEVLPAVMTQKQLIDGDFTTPAQMESYKAAAKAPRILYQLPCYCYCDRNHGHTSLHSCFESPHGANCGTCMAEALYAYKMSKKGWSAKMIREGVIRRDFTQIDLQNPDPVK